MEPVLHSLQPVLRGALILGLWLSVFAQIPAVSDASVFPSERKAPEFSLTVLPSALIGRRVATPTCKPGTGVYSNNQNVSCTIASGATGCFTTSGIPPTAPTPGTVSYTHLDVYKRQVYSNNRRAWGLRGCTW